MEKSLMHVSLTTSNDLNDWQSFVDSQPNADAYHHAAWFSILGEASAVRRFFLMVRGADEKVAGILPLYLSSSPFLGRHLTSLDGGILADNPKARDAILSKALELKEECRAGYLLIRGGLDDYPNADGTIETVRRIIDMGQSAENIWEGLSRYVKRDIRRAEKRGFYIAEDPELEKLADFYKIYARHMQELGTPVTTPKLMRGMFLHLGREKLKLFLVFHGSEVVGGILCVINSQSLTALYASVRSDLMGSYANYLLYWHTIEAVTKENSRYFDLGRNMPNSLVYDFKKKWPGSDRLVQYKYFGNGTSKAMARIAKIRDGQGLMQQTWKRLPPWIADKLGPIIRMQIPFT